MHTLYLFFVIQRCNTITKELEASIYLRHSRFLKNLFGGCIRAQKQIGMHFTQRYEKCISEIV